MVNLESQYSVHVKLFFFLFFFGQNLSLACALQTQQNDMCAERRLKISCADSEFSLGAHVILLVIPCGGSFGIVTAFKYSNDSVWQSRGGNALSRKKNKKEHGMQNTLTKHVYPSRHQRKIAYTNTFSLEVLLGYFS